MRRFSSRREAISESFLKERLRGALSYDRIAGYFRSSLFAVAGEEIESVSGKVRVVCNSELNAQDVQTARKAEQAMRKEWCEADPIEWAEEQPERLRRLYRLLTSGKLEVRVLPREGFGLLHGKAGVITQAGGEKTSFLGSANATAPGWANNYELLWEDERPESVAWVQEEFEALWTHRLMRPLAAFVVKDIKRLSERDVVQTVAAWEEEDDPPAASSVELPVFREGFGLWEHQKYFVDRAFRRHTEAGGARFVLADEVGLGKTIQLGLAAQLIALKSSGPVLIAVPNALTEQWQEELHDMLDMPSAVWDQHREAWIDEEGIEHPAGGPEGITDCPRRTGIVSHSRFVHQTEDAGHLAEMRYACVVVDEAHKARRKNNAQNDPASDAPDPNNLYAFLTQIARQTESLLLGTATPVQLRPVEAWDLLNILATGTEGVLGNEWARWRQYPEQALALAMGEEPLPDGETDFWDWARNPLPPAGEDRAFKRIRGDLGYAPTDHVADGSDLEKLSRGRRRALDGLRGTFAEQHNPFIRHIIKRTRSYLEDTIDPDTGEPYMDRIEIQTHGEGPEGAIGMPPYMRRAYDHARDFCTLLAKRKNASGFMKTLLLRRIGSTFYAGQKTAERMIEKRTAAVEGAEDETESAGDEALKSREVEKLESLQDALEIGNEEDRKRAKAEEYLLDKGWIEKGCIVFSQYYDSVWWLGKALSQGGRLAEEPVGLYAGKGRSGLFRGGVFQRKEREGLKRRVQSGRLRLLLGTQSASEGLNLQRLSTLINLDLPWNPTRLEQRKGRIQRIGQVADTIHIYNMRYKGSVEEDVHEMISKRLKNIHSLFGQVPNFVEDAWVSAALQEKEEAEAIIDKVPDQHPFALRYEQAGQVSHLDWESCSNVLDRKARREKLLTGW
jgi:superfamily II DNA or RNA helicase